MRPSWTSTSKSRFGLCNIGISLNLGMQLANNMSSKVARRKVAHRLMFAEEMKLEEIWHIQGLIDRPVLLPGECSQIAEVVHESK